MKLRSGKIYYYDINDEPEYQYYARLGRQFNTWKAEVNRLCIREVNLGCDDLPDMPYYSYFVEGVTSKRMKDLLLRDTYYCMIE